MNVKIDTYSNGSITVEERDNNIQIIFSEGFDLSQVSVTCLGVAKDGDGHIDFNVGCIVKACNSKNKHQK